MRIPSYALSSMSVFAEIENFKLQSVCVGFKLMGKLNQRRTVRYTIGRKLFQSISKPVTPVCSKCLQRWEFQRWRRTKELKSSKHLGCLPRLCNGVLRERHVELRVQHSKCLLKTCYACTALPSLLGFYQTAALTPWHCLILETTTGG